MVSLRPVVLALLASLGGGAATSMWTRPMSGRVTSSPSRGTAALGLDRWRGGATMVADEDEDMSDEDVEDVEVEEEEEVEEAEEEEGMQPTLLSVELDESLDHAVVQLPSKLMRELGLSEGSVVRLKGKRRSKTVCTVTKGPGLKGMMARMGTSALRNLRLKDGQVLRVEEDVSEGKKGAPPAALTVTIAPFSDTLEDVDVEAREELAKEYISQLPANAALHAGDHFKTDDVEWKVIGLTSAHVADEDEEVVEGEEAPEEDDADIAVFGGSTELIFGEDELIRDEDDEAQNEVTYDDLGGCAKPLAAMRELVEMPLRHPELFTAVGVPPPHGVLLHGAPGSGKTLLAKAVATESGVYVKTINGPEVMSRKSGESESNLRAAFDDARANAPAIILIDEIDSIAPKREKAGGEVEKRMVSQLLTLMDGLKPSEAVIVIAATNQPNTIDTALRRFGRFDRELDMGVPDTAGRVEILQVKTRDMKLAKDVSLEDVAEDCQGFVGADIAQLCLDAALQAVRDQLGNIDIDADALDSDLLDNISVNQKHLLSAASKCNPSSLRESMIETPNVKWDDIGGLWETKRELQETVEYPVQFAEKYRQFGMQPSKGVLFYGPPGCGKTLMAQAVANECGSNFISVKGPELLTMWFGESEANVRNLFDKARAASPCILFFDEMDSIAKARSDGASGGNDAGDRVMNQILAEIDQAGLTNVFVIGATNRPDILDPAITRPGRLDQLIYIPMPDYESRVSIFKANLRKAPVAPDINFEMLASVTEGFSGADVSEICQRAAKNAVRESIAAEEAMYLEEELAEANDPEGYLEAEFEDEDLGEDEDIEDPVPFITKSHFEEAMGFARKSVPQSEITRYIEFQKKMKADANQGGARDFKFKKGAAKAEGEEGAAPAPKKEGKKAKKEKKSDA